MSKVLLVVNPSSGGEQAEEFQELAQESLQKIFSEVETLLTKGEGDATEFSRKSATENYDALFVMGGDGTINEAIRGLAEMPYRPKFGFFPLGTVNDLARSLNISLEPKEAIQNVIHYQTRKLDVGKINDSYFMNTVAIGDIPEAVNDVSVEDKTKLGPLAYFVAGLKSFFSNQERDFHIELDGKAEDFIGSTILIGLTNSMGGFENLLPDAKVDDGLLHMIFLEDQSKIDLVKAAPQLLQGVNQDGSNVSYRTFKQGTIALTDDGENLNANVDGDSGLSLPLELKVLPSHLEVYCPSNDKLD